MHFLSTAESVTGLVHVFEHLILFFMKMNRNKNAGNLYESGITFIM